MYCLNNEPTYVGRIRVIYPYPSDDLFYKIQLRIKGFSAFYLENKNIDSYDFILWIIMKVSSLGGFFPQII